jgi:cytochrome c5
VKRFHSRTRIRLHAIARKVVRPRSLSFAFALLVLPIVSVLLYEVLWEFREGSPGAVATSPGYFGDGHDEVKYLSQGWSAAESAWFYSVNQGSDLIPYDFFLSLDSAGKGDPFFSEANVRRWRYLSQVASGLNPDALPVGFAKDEYNGRPYVGLTCAACHTGQINYGKTAIRIDGGPSMADMQTFMHDLSAAVDATTQLGADGKCVGDVCKRFVARVLARGSYGDESEVTLDLLATQRRLAVDEASNSGGTSGDARSAYGYARLDAFGRIYNRVLDTVLRKKDLEEILPELFNSAELPIVRKELSPVLDGKEESELIERALPLLTPEQRSMLVKGLFNPSTAPVSYPFLWDTPQHDYVQWNGIVANETFGPLGRNAGEVIGVFGTLDWTLEEHKGATLSSILGGQGFGPSPVSYTSSIDIHNLRRVEAKIARLESPKWPEDLLGKINHGYVSNGKSLFVTYCASCHAEITRDSPERRVVASMTSQIKLGTDPTMADNSVQYSGYAGMLRNQYVDFPVGAILIDRKSPVAALLTQATHGVIAAPYPTGKGLQLVRRVRNAADWVIDRIRAYASNEIKASIKFGGYDPDTTEAPFASLLAYKGRALNGIWATAPYLHNGSVPTLYDILLPKRAAGDPDDGEYRPDSFVVGSREFDPVKVGFRSEGYEGFKFDTTLPGNSNAGHEYGTLHDASLKERHLEPLTKDQRRDLLEYLKDQ